MSAGYLSQRVCVYAESCILERTRVEGYLGMVIWRIGKPIPSSMLSIACIHSATNCPRTVKRPHTHTHDGGWPCLFATRCVCASDGCRCSKVRSGLVSALFRGGCVREQRHAHVSTKYLAFTALARIPYVGAPPTGYMLTTFHTFSSLRSSQMSGRCCAL